MSPTSPPSPRSPLLPTLPHPLLALPLLTKLLLLLLAYLAPGPGYDTSTRLLYSELHNNTVPQLPWWVHKLVRWDGVYFVGIARPGRGYVFEQEWAFGWGWTRMVRWVAAGFVKVDLAHPVYAPATAGIVLAHGSHLLSVLLLYRISRLVLPAFGSGAGKEAAWVAAALHALSPAGMFLSAPYAEGMFSLLSFAGAGLYAGGVVGRGGGEGGGVKGKGGKDGGAKGWGEWKGDVMVVAAGVVWGVAAMCRGNGLLWGLVFVVDAVERVGGLFLGWGRGRGSWGPERVREELWGLGIAVLAGGCLGVGFALPQVLAWREYCTGVEEGEVLREWCGKRVPSIYAWVQSHYWNVGFFRYWTVSNIPLFLLAAPMLAIMATSAIWGLTRGSGSTEEKTGDGKIEEGARQPERARRVVLRLAIPQLVLAVMALTSYHVQIITRLSSGYPVWYWWLASMMSENREMVVFGTKWQPAKVITRWTVVYAMVQGGLFVSFLPPA